MSNAKLLFAVGGTGGHVFPAIGLAAELQELEPALSILFAGGGIKCSADHPIPFPYKTISCAPLSTRNPLKGIRNIRKIAKGVREATKLLKDFSPSLIIGFGSYYSLPILTAAVWKRAPYVLHEQNRIPGRVIRLFSSQAAFTGIHIPGTETHIKGSTLTVGMPLRRDILQKAGSIEEAKKYFGLSKTQPIVLIFGGSQGASSINQLVFQGIEQIESVPFQILHFTGNEYDREKLARLYSLKGVSACVKPFERQMHLAWKLADCVISRSGASSIAEQIEMEVPGILIPYPYAMDLHQDANADFFVKEVRGGVKFSDIPGSGDKLIESVIQCVQDTNLATFKTNIKQYKCRRIEANFSREILRLINLQ